MKPVLMVVDDEPIVRMDLVEAAREQGFETIEAACAAEALKILDARNDIRAVFTDIRMPGDMDGLGLAHAVRERWPPTVIVICSGNQTPRAEDLPSNVVFVSKPCSGTRMVELLSSVFEQLN